MIVWNSSHSMTWGNWTRTDNPDILCGTASVLGIRFGYIYSILLHSVWCCPSGQHLITYSNPAPPSSIGPCIRPCHSNSTASPVADHTSCTILSTSFIHLPRPPTNTDTAEDKKTPDDSAPSPSSTPYVVPTPVTPLQDTRKVLASDHHSFEVPLPVLWSGYVLPHCLVQLLTHLDIHRSLTPNVRFIIQLLSTTWYGLKHVSFCMPLLPPAKSLGFCWWGEYPPTSKSHVPPSSMANSACRLQTASLPFKKL